MFRAKRIHKNIHVERNTYDIVADSMTVWVALDTGLGTGSNVQRVGAAGVKSEGCDEEGGERRGPWEFAVHENGSDAGRSRLTFRPLACCSRGAFINSSVLIPRIDEWPPIAIPRARCPHLSPPAPLPLHPPRINSTSRRIWTQFPLRKFPFMYSPLKYKYLDPVDANDYFSLHTLHGMHLFNSIAAKCASILKDWFLCGDIH